MHGQALAPRGANAGSRATRTAAKIAPSVRGEAGRLSLDAGAGLFSRSRHWLTDCRLRAAASWGPSEIFLARSCALAVCAPVALVFAGESYGSERFELFLMALVIVV